MRFEAQEASARLITENRYHTSSKKGVVAAINCANEEGNVVHELRHKAARNLRVLSIASFDKLDERASLNKSK